MIYIIRCRGLILLETYSALDESHLLDCIPKFLEVEKQVTGNPDYSMFNLSLREDWKTSKKFCKSITAGNFSLQFFITHLLNLFRYQSPRRKAKHLQWNRAEKSRNHHENKRPFKRRHN